MMTKNKILLEMDTFDAYYYGGDDLALETIEKYLSTYQHGNKR